VLWVLGEIWKGVMKEPAQQTAAMNEQALGRIVAGLKREGGFISAPTQSASAVVHGVFRT
jgi:hypothetical protein